MKAGPARIVEIRQARVLVLQPETLAGSGDRLERKLDELENRGLLPLVSFLAAGKDRGALSQAVVDRLELALAAGRAGALRWEATIEQVLAALNSAEIEPTLLKGGDLAFHAYPEPGLRAMTDLDLLVAPGKLAAAHRALVSIGFRRIPTTFSDDWYRICRDQLPPLAHNELGVHIDVHGSLMPPYSPFRLPSRTERQGLRPSRWTGASRLSAEMMLWHLSVHACIMHLGHTDHSRRATVDLLVLAAAGETIDGAALENIARRSHTVFAVLRALELAGPPDGMTVLAERLRGVREGPIVRSRTRVVHALRSLAPWVGLGRGRPPDALYQLASRPARLAGAALRADRRGRPEGTTP